MQQIDNAGFDKLRFRYRRADPQNRFIREEDGTLRHGINITGETERCQTIQQIRPKSGMLTQQIQVSVFEPGCPEKFDYLLKPRCDQKVPVRRKLPDEKLEYRSRRHRSLVIGFQHRELIEIRQKQIGHARWFMDRHIVLFRRLSARPQPIGTG